MGLTDKISLDALRDLKGAYKKAKLPCILYGSTLLGVIRDGESLGGADVCFRDVDYKQEMDEYLLSAGSTVVSKSAFRDRGYFSHNYNGCVVESHIIYYYKDWAYSNIKGKDLLIWPKRMYNKLDTIKWMNDNWFIPHDVEGWLTLMYGKNWKTPSETWSWNHCPNLVDVDKLDSGGNGLKDEYFNKID